MSYEDFPWFKKQSIEAVLNVEELSPDHYYWPAIDVDLTKEIIKNPDRFPLKAKVSRLGQQNLNADGRSRNYNVTCCIY